MKTLVFRLDDSEPGAASLYVPVPAQGAPLPSDLAVRARDDREGLSLLRERLGHDRLACTPDLARAAGSLGLAVLPAAEHEAELRAEVALALWDPALLAATPSQPRRELFRALADFLAGAWREVSLTGTYASVEVEGMLAGRSVRAELGAQGSPQALLLNARWAAEGEVWTAFLSLAPRLGFVREALERAYGVAFDPSFLATLTCERELKLLAAALRGLSGLSHELPSLTRLEQGCELRARLHAC